MACSRRTCSAGREPLLPQQAGVLVDEQFGADILRDAKKKGYFTVSTTEKSGQAGFDFEYGEDSAKHIEVLQPTFAKVLVRYNPEGDAALNERQAVRLKLLSDFLHGKSRGLFMFELLVLPEQAQLDKVKGDKKAYDTKTSVRRRNGCAESMPTAARSIGLSKTQFQ